MELLGASSGNSVLVVLLFVAAPFVESGSSVSDSAKGLEFGQVQDSAGDGRLLVVSILGLFFFGFPLRQATLYVQRLPLLTHRSHSGCCFGQATLYLAHESQANLIFCFEAVDGGCICDCVCDCVCDCEVDVGDDIVS